MVSREKLKLETPGPGIRFAAALAAKLFKSLHGNRHTTRRTSNCQVGLPAVLSIDLSSYGLSVTKCHTLRNFCLARRYVR